jgi:hypothetical protein
MGIRAYFGAAAAASTLLLATSASAGLTHDYQLNGSLTDAAGGPDIVNRAGGGSLGSTGITFGADLGPTITGYNNTGVYSVEMAFKLDAVNGYRSILEPINHDDNLYVVNGGLQFFPGPTGPFNQVAADTLVQVIFTHNAAGIGIGYLNGVEQFAFNDVNQRGVIVSELHFFNDDNTENSSGFVDYIRTYDVALNQDQVNTLARGGTLDFGGGDGGIPEPATWALMIAGFGLMGATLRRRDPRSA